MSKENEKVFTVLDGNDEQSNEIADDFLSTITDEDKKRSMSSEYDYLDD